MTTRYYDYIVEKILTAQRTANALAKRMEHHGLEGQIREIAVKECIEPFLTHSFHCGTGKIIDSLENLTDQLDLVIYQTKAAPPILINQDLGLFPVECCRYAIEVKSTLTATEIKDSIKKFNSIKKLISYPRKQENGEIVRGGLPATVLFAFDSDVTGSEIDRFLKYEASDLPATTVLCVLGKGYWFYRDNAWHGKAASSEKPFHEFCMFITGFMNTLASEETIMRGFTPGGYVNVDESPIPSVITSA
ncbi:DUF6602 domain-containing protein [Aeromonas schubertii]|uniref:DUF6602 domain-containing protein n=1 Tax=Aeromonas schubertii TaxID=652 RepID=UPI000B298997|nr:DUF6602 domain-containing protein [Aeromonas schubertii]